VLRLAGDVGDRAVDQLDRDRADLRDPEVLEVADDQAGVLARHVAEDQVALGLVRGAGEADHVGHTGGGAEQPDDLRGQVGRHDDP
jgi:hypothetical protein